jgi:hypothetical protein
VLVEGGVHGEGPAVADVEPAGAPPGIEAVAVVEVEDQEAAGSERVGHGAEHRAQGTRRGGVVEGVEEGARRGAGAVGERLGERAVQPLDVGGARLAGGGREHGGAAVHAPQRPPGMMAVQGEEERSRAATEIGEGGRTGGCPEALQSCQQARQHELPERAVAGLPLVVDRGQRLIGVAHS